MEEDDIIVSGQSCSHWSHAALTSPPCILYATAHTQLDARPSASRRTDSSVCVCVSLLSEKLLLKQVFVGLEVGCDVVLYKYIYLLCMRVAKCIYECMHGVSIR